MKIETANCIRKVSGNTLSTTKDNSGGIIYQHMILTQGDDAMNVSELAKELNLAVFSGRKGLSRNITGGYVSDLLNDVIENASKGKVWITLQTHEKIVDIASRKELACVLLVSSLIPEQNTIELSNEAHIPVLGTSMSTFEIAGLLYQKLKGVQ